jgi:GABA permease
MSIFYSSAASLILLVANYTLPQAVLVPLIATIGTIALVMYLVIAISHVILRKRAIASGEKLLVKVPFFPVLSYITIAFILVFLGLMAVAPGHQMELGISAVLSLILVGVGVYLQRRNASGATVMSRV